MEVVSLWVAITESTPENGCLRVIPRTHAMELRGLRERRDVDNLFDVEIDAQIDESEAVDLILNPGDVSVHHPNIVHGSEPNASHRWRNGLTIRYIPTSTRITEPEHASPFLLRGRAVEGINDYLDPPAYDSDRHMAFRGSET
jgi:ectoine hydroxylase-related dioxygenase (phytanoyl-CoA dioxygenase family)